MADANPHLERLRGAVRVLRPLSRLSADRFVLGLLLFAALLAGGRAWLAENPGSNPWAPLDLNDEPGWATRDKVMALREDPAQCRAVLERSEVSFTALDPVGEEPCRRENRTLLDGFPYAGDRPDTTCAMAAALEIWRRDSVQPVAQEIFGQEVARIEHFGSFSCRRINGAPTGRWSEHATGNAIDIAGFVLEDGTRIAVVNHWAAGDERARFLRQVRDGACRAFGTVLSPDYNAAHRDHFHFDQQGRGFGGVCH